MHYEGAPRFGRLKLSVDQAFDVLALIKAKQE